MSEQKGLGDLITTDVKVGMNEVVNVFVSQYEDKLHVRKLELQQVVKGLKQERKDHDEAVLEQYRMHGNKFEDGDETLRLTSEVKDVTVMWDKKHSKQLRTLFPKQVVQFDVKVKSLDKSNSYGSNSIDSEMFVAINEGDITLHNSIVERLGEASSELSAVLVQIKSVSRKERQIRGKISQMRLAEGGYSHLVEDPELIQLVQLD